MKRIPVKLTKNDIDEGLIWIGSENIDFFPKNSRFPRDRKALNTLKNNGVYFNKKESATKIRFLLKEIQETVMGPVATRGSGDTRPDIRPQLKKYFKNRSVNAEEGDIVRILLKDGVYEISMEKNYTSEDEISIDRPNLLKSPPPIKDIESHRSDKDGDPLAINCKPGSFYMDQFGLSEMPSGEAQRRESTSQVYERSPKVREYVLERAKGHCEWCGSKGFTTSKGSTYLETHHIQPLSEEGDDSIFNVIALCPNHHREAHFGENSQQTKKALLDRIDKLKRPVHATPPKG